MGENVLAAIQEFTKVLSGSPPAPSTAHASGYAYFDLLGKVMVSHHESASAGGGARSLELARIERY